MPSINLTNNTSLNLAASSADGNASLNRYLAGTLTFRTPPSFDAIASLPVKNLDSAAFPVNVAAAGEGQFAVNGTTLDVQAAASAEIGLLQGDSETDFLHSVGYTADASNAGVVSFAVTGTLSLGDSATLGDFTFGTMHGSSLTLTGYYLAGPGEALGSAVLKAVRNLTIPHDLDDLKSIPAGAICQVDGSSSLKFTASASYSFINDPLAAASIAQLPSLSIQATSGATLEATVTHTSGHTLTLARLLSGLLHLSVAVGNTDDFETSLTVSAGVAGNIGNTDALAFLLDRINPNASTEADAIASQMPNAAGFRDDIKSGIEQSLAAALGVSIKAAIERNTARNRVFLFEINLDALDGASQFAVQAALTRDFTVLTKSGARLAGITSLDQTLTLTTTNTHSFGIHLLGIFNAESIGKFVAKSKVNFTKDTSELVLSDTELQIVDNNLDGEKLRKLVLRDITLTLPASANTPAAAAPITIAYLDREASPSHGRVQQYANLLTAADSEFADAARNLANQNRPSYGTCALYVGLKLDPARCRQVFLDGNGVGYDWLHYVDAISRAERIIFAGIPNDWHAKVFSAGHDVWTALSDAGSQPSILLILRQMGLPEGQALAAVTAVMTSLWWSQAMAGYGKALQRNESLIKAGQKVVRDSNQGFDEPWLLLTLWDLAGRPQMDLRFLSPPASAAAARL